MMLAGYIATWGLIYRYSPHATAALKSYAYLEPLSCSVEIIME